MSRQRSGRGRALPTYYLVNQIPVCDGYAVSLSGLYIEVSAGELLDRKTILTLKCRRLRSRVDRAAARATLDGLTDALGKLPDTPELTELVDELARTNACLWELEDTVRELKRQGELGSEFVQSARRIFELNEHRARTKCDIDTVLGSRLTEVKSHHTPKA